jgi:thiamine pyrophosphokinase
MLAGREVRLVDGQQMAWLVRGHTDITGQIGDTVSLIPLGGAVHVARTTNLRWPLQDEWLHFGPARGVSNELTAAHATVHLHSGQLLCIIQSQRFHRLNLYLL